MFCFHSLNYKINSINVKLYKCLIVNDLQRRGPARRKPLIVNNLQLIEFRQKEAGDFVPRLG
jgi:hypothetical protein